MNIDKEKVLVEIERLKAEIPYHENAWSVLNKLKEFINSLPAGQLNNDVEEEVNDYFEKHLELCNDGTLKCGGKEFDTYDLLNVIDYFITWQKNQIINKACEWLLENVSAELVLPVEDKVLVKDFIKNFKKAMEDELCQKKKKKIYC